MNWDALGAVGEIVGKLERSTTSEVRQVDSWPREEAATVLVLAREEELELVVQVNGKVRARLRVAAGISEPDAVEQALTDEAVQRAMDGREVKKTVYVQDRLVNLVV